MAGVPSLPGPSHRPGLSGDLPAPLEQRGQLLKQTIFSGTAANMAAVAPACAAGHLLVMTGTWASTSDLVSAGTIADDAGNTWHIGPVGSGQNPGVFICWSLLTNALTTANTVTVTFSSGTPAARMCQFIDYGTAWTGLDASTSGSAASGAQSATATSTQPGDAVLYATGFNGQATGDADFKLGNDLAKIAQTHHTGTTTAYLVSGDALAPSAGAYSTGANGNQNQSTWAVALLQPAVVASTVTPPRPVVQDQAAFARQPLNRSHQSRVLQPPVQAAAAAAQTIVTFDAATQAGGLTFNHTTSGLNRYLTVGIAIGGTTVSVTGITYAGAAMTRLNRSVGPGTGAELWGLVNPALGTNSVAITLSGAAGSQPGAVSFTNANQQVEPGVTGGNTSTSSTALSATLAGPAGAMIVDALASNASTTGITSGVQAWNDGAGDAQAYLQATGALQQISWSLSASSGWADAAAVVLPAGPIVTPLPAPVVVHASPVPRDAQTRRASNVYIGGRQQLAATTTAPTVTPPPRVVVQSLVASGEQRRHVHGSVVAPVVHAAAAPTQPNPRQVTIQAAQLAARRARHGGVVQSRWPGYEWAGLAPVTPTPKQVVQDQAAVWQAREDHRRGLIVAPSVQAAAAIAGAAPIVPPLPKQVVVDQAAFQPRRQQHGGRVLEPGVQLAAAVAPPPPTVTPPRTVTIVQAAQQPRQHRRGVVTAPRPVQGVTTRPIVSVVAARPPSVQTRRHGCVTAPRRVTAPVAPPRPVVVHPTPQRRRRGGSVTALHGRFVQTGGPTTLITTPLTGYVSVGDRGSVATCDTAQPPAGDTGIVKTGNTGFPQI